jgi:hypothetical protein
LPIAFSRAQAIRAIPPVALGIEAIPPGLANRMAKSSWSVAGLTAPKANDWRALQGAG